MILYALVVFAVLLLFIKWVLDTAWKNAGRAFERRHRLAYAIIQSRKIPHDWLKRSLRRSRSINRRTGPDASPSTDIFRKETRLKKRAKKVAIRRLSSLVTSYDRGGSFETLQAKKIFMNEINSVLQAWRDTPASRIDEIVASKEVTDPFTPQTS